MTSDHSSDRSLGLLYFTYGIVFACGCSFSYQPSLVILGHYFKRRLGLVNGIVTAGSGIFTITLPFVLSGLLERVGLQNTLRVLCVLIFVLVLAGFTYRPLLPVAKNAAAASSRGRASRLFNLNIWKSLGYRIWAFGIPAALYGYFVPYVHLVSCHLLFSPAGEMSFCCAPPPFTLSPSLLGSELRGIVLLESWSCHPGQGSSSSALQIKILDKS